MIRELLRKVSAHACSDDGNELICRNVGKPERSTHSESTVDERETRLQAKTESSHLPVVDEDTPLAYQIQHLLKGNLVMVLFVVVGMRAAVLPGVRDRINGGGRNEVSSHRES